MHRRIRHLFAASTLLLVGACADNGREWPERGFLLAGGEAVPVSCLGSYGQTDGALPLGCANELNLTRMVEATSDLVVPRQAGAAFAAPLAAAAERYLGLAEQEQDSAGGSEQTQPNVERIVTGAMPDASAPTPTSP